MASQSYSFQPVSFGSNAFSSFNFQQSSASVFANPSSSPQPTMNAHSHPHLSASPTHSQVHDYSDSLSVSHSSIPFPSANRITANEFGGDTLEVEDTHGQSSHMPNPFNAFTSFSNAAQATNSSTFSSANAIFNSFQSLANGFQNAQTQTATAATSPFNTFSQSTNASSSSSASPFAQSDAQSSSFNASQLTNNFKMFGAVAAQSSAAVMPSSPAPASPSSPAPSSSSSSSKGGFFNIQVSADVLLRRPALARVLEKREQLENQKRKRPLDCLDSPALLRALQHTKMARTEESSSSKQAATNEDDKENQSKNDNLSKDEVSTSSQMQEEVKRPVLAAVPPTVSSTASLGSVAVNRRRPRTEEMDTAPSASASSSSSSGAHSHAVFHVKRSRNHEEAPASKSVRFRDSDEENKFPAHDYSKTVNDFEFPRGKKVNTSGEPVYTLDQVKKLLLAALKNQQDDLRQEFSVILRELLKEQFDSFSQFNLDYLSRQMAKSESHQSYIS